MIKKITILLIFVILSVAVLSSCHGINATPAFDVPDEFNTGKTYEITFWAKNDSNLTQVNIYNQTIENFEKLYPNIKVTLKRYTDYGKIYNDVITNISTGTTPNVCITYPDHIATYMTGENVVVPLDRLIEDAKYGFGGSDIRFDSVKAEEIVPEFMQECKIGGITYAVPFMRSTEACYVNKTYVEALGYTLPDILTWDFIFEVSEAALEKNSDGTYKANGKTTLIPFIYKSTDNMMIQMLKQKDAGYSNSNGDIQIFNETTDEILKAIAKHANQYSFSTFKIDGYPGNFFNKGQCLFAVDSTAGATWMGADAPLLDIPEDQIAEFETAVMPVPQYNTENIEMISQGPSVCIFNKEDHNEVLASWLFVQYLLTNEVQIEFSKTEGYVPVTKKAQNSFEYQDYLSRSGEDNDVYYNVKISASKLLLENIENTFVTPVFNGSTSLRNAAGHLIEEVAKASMRKKTVDDAFIDSLYESTTSLYKLTEAHSSGGLPELEPIPTESVVLITSLSCIWLMLAGVFLTKKLKKRKYR
jgi:multiple sugar transport system substrate-binding protein